MNASKNISEASISQTIGTMDGLHSKKKNDMEKMRRNRKQRMDEIVKSFKKHRAHARTHTDTHKLYEVK